MDHNQLSSAATDSADLMPPRGLSATRFKVGTQDVAVLSFPVPEYQLPDSLTNAERDVVDMLLRGHSNAEIGEHRGTSVRTVANQVAAVFRKLGVTSRAALMAKLGR